jgi:hypothetical protein
MPADEQQLRSANSVLQGRLARDFAFVLLKTIDAVKNDPAQFRNLIYEMARARLQREAWHRNPPMSVLELRRMMLVLETAIERVETDSVVRESLPLLAARGSTELMEHPSETASPDPSSAVMDNQPAQGSVVVAARELAGMARAIRVPVPLKAMLRLAAIATAAAAIVLVVDREFHLLTAPPAAITTAAAAPPAPPQSAASVAPLVTASLAAVLPASEPAPAARVGPVPAVYGIYAVSDGKLFELQPLQGRVPDARIFMSAVISKPSQTVLPSGQVTFIVFRREIATSAPDHVTVRTIAKVARDLTFSKSGRPAIVKVDDAWAIRNVSFDYQVAPSPDSREMILIKPQGDAMVLSPGRYGLIINGIAYDFTVDGPVTEPAQCLERTEAANGTFYAECRTL